VVEAAVQAAQTSLAPKPELKAVKPAEAKE